MSHNLSFPTEQSTPLLVAGKWYLVIFFNDCPFSKLPFTSSGSSSQQLLGGGGQPHAGMEWRSHSRVLLVSSFPLEPIRIGLIHLPCDSTSQFGKTVILKDVDNCPFIFMRSCFIWSLFHSFHMPATILNTGDIALHKTDMVFVLMGVKVYLEAYTLNKLTQHWVSWQGKKQC